MRKHFGKAQIRRIVIELDNNTEFIIDPQYQRVQTLRRGYNGFVTGYGDVSLEKFLATGEELFKDMEKFCGDQKDN